MGTKGGASIHGDGDFVPMDPSRLLGDGRKLSTRYRIDDAHITVALVDHQQRLRLGAGR